MTSHQDWREVCSVSHKKNCIVIGHQQNLTTCTLYHPTILAGNKSLKRRLTRRKHSSLSVDFIYIPLLSS